MRGCANWRRLEQTMTIRDFTDAELEKLHINQRNALTAHVCNNVPYADIATAFNIPIGTVRSRINRARAKIERMRQAGG